MKSDPNVEAKLTFRLKNNMRNLVNFNASSGKSENLYFDEVLLSKVCNVWAQKGTDELFVKNYLWFQKSNKEFSKQVVEIKIDKSSVYTVLAEGIYFLDKNSPLNFKFLKNLKNIFSCPNSSCGFWNQESVLV